MKQETTGPDCPSQDLTGKRVGDYEVIRRLGRGGMADVYLAEQVSLRRKIALKVLKKELARDQSYVERFRREAQSAAALVQANIVQIYEVGEIDGHNFIAQEYVPGRNLRQYLSRFGAVEPIMTMNVMRQVALALQKAGELNVIHRDIKPENILLSPGGEAKVADFGLARINNDAARQALTQIGITMGTPLYMSPEQIEGRSVDPRSDIYSLGITAYQMLAGKPPFDGDTALAIALQHVQNEPEPLLQIRPDVPPELIRLIERMMSKHPDDRPENATKLLSEMRKIKIDADQDWQQVVENLASESAFSGAKQRADSLAATTKRLQRVMRGNIRSWWTSPVTILTFFVLSLCALFSGFWLAAQSPIPDILESGTAVAQLVPKLSTVVEQYRFSYQFPDENHWQAVIDFFPVENAASPNMTQLYHNLAKERLGELYIQKKNFKGAEEIYKQLVKSDSERQKIVGVAGMAIAHAGQGDDDLAYIMLLRIPDEALIEDSSVALNNILRPRIVDLKAALQVPDGHIQAH